MKKITGYIFAMLMVFFALIVIDLGVFCYLSLSTDTHDRAGSVEKVSEKIVYSNGEYIADPSISDSFGKHFSFAMIIDDNGDVVWEYDKPEDIPNSFTIKDVASFNRWYLNDHPVYTWIRDDGLLVVGLSKNSTWKYMVELSIDTLSAIGRVIPCVIIINVLILIFVPILITRKRIADREKSRTEWIAGVSHDIRTPLSIVMGSAEKGSVVEKQCLKMRNLIGNLNTENKLDSGTGKWTDEKIVIAPLLRDIMCDYINTYEPEYKFDLFIDDKAEAGCIRADVTLIRRMIDNLLNNAIVHNENGCEIKVSLVPTNRGKVKLTIRDNGKGVDSQKIKNLNARIKSNYLPEHGLGIRVVKQVAKKYRFRVRFSSEQNRYFSSEITI